MLRLEEPKKEKAIRKVIMELEQKFEKQLHKAENMTGSKAHAEAAKASALNWKCKEKRKEFFELER